MACPTVQRTRASPVTVPGITRPEHLSWYSCLAAVGRAARRRAQRCRSRAQAARPGDGGRSWSGRVEPPPSGAEHDAVTGHGRPVAILAVVEDQSAARTGVHRDSSPSLTRFGRSTPLPKVPRWSSLLIPHNLPGAAPEPLCRVRLLCRVLLPVGGPGRARSRASPASGQGIPNSGGTNR
jgi:hypothetical protein